MCLHFATCPLLRCISCPFYNPLPPYHCSHRRETQCFAFFSLCVLKFSAVFFWSEFLFSLSFFSFNSSFPFLYFPLFIATCIFSLSSFSDNLPTFPHFVFLLFFLPLSLLRSHWCLLSLWLSLKALHFYPLDFFNFSLVWFSLHSLIIYSCIYSSLSLSLVHWFFFSFSCLPDIFFFSSISNTSLAFPIHSSCLVFSVLPQFNLSLYFYLTIHFSPLQIFSTSLPKLSFTLFLSLSLFILSLNIFRFLLPFHSFICQS